jgi:hypothetical protein
MERKYIGIMNLWASFALHQKRLKVGLKTQKPALWQVLAGRNTQF